MIYDISFHLMKRYFCYPIFKTTWFVTMAHGNVKKWRQDDTRTVYRNSQSLYHAASSMFFILQLKTAIYYLTSDLFICLWESLVTYNFFLNFAIRYLLSFKILNIERIKIFTGWNKTQSVYFIIRIGLLGLIELVT